VEQEVEDQVPVQELLEIQEDQEVEEHGLHLEQVEQVILRQLVLRKVILEEMQ
jgi:hypothetical protein